MSCLSHTCHRCGAMWEDNHTNGECPKCGHWGFSSHFDEPMNEDDELDEIRSAIYADLKVGEIR